MFATVAAKLLLLLLNIIITVLSYLLLIVPLFQILPFNVVCNRAICECKNLCTKNNYDLTLRQSHLHTASKTFVRHKNNLDPVEFSVFLASVASI